MERSSQVRDWRQVTDLTRALRSTECHSSKVMPRACRRAAS